MATAVARLARKEKRSTYKFNREDLANLCPLDIFDLTKGNFKHETKHSVQQSNLGVSPAAGECSWVIIEWIPPRSYESSRV